jgi:D-sedoheptulose 7-phosphate isomerase
MQEYLKARIVEHIEITDKLMQDAKLLEVISKAAIIMVDAFRANKKLLICGNGGSAADSQHIATELVSRFYNERKALDAEALTINTSSLTAIGNDYSFDKVFSRQIEAKGNEGDVLLGISTSGNSKNVIEGIIAAKKIGMATVSLTGENRGAQIYNLSDYCICVPSNITPRIQEAHILIGHILCEFIEEKLFAI